jgi:hypothetical protein
VISSWLFLQGESTPACRPKRQELKVGYPEYPVFYMVIKRKGTITIEIM